MKNTMENVKKIPIEYKKEKNIKAKGRLDKKLLSIVFILSLIGLIMILSASTPMSIGDGNSPYYLFIRHIIYLCISIFAMFFAYKTSFYKYNKLIIALFVLSYIGVLLIFTPLGVKNYGAVRWLNLGVISIMPSDFLKIASILFVAYILSKNRKKTSSFKFVILYLIFIGIVIFPVYKQPDYSTLIVIAATLFAMLFFAGAKLWHILILAALGIVLGIIGIIKEPYRLARLLSTFNPMEYRSNESWQLVNALYGVASGGLTGVGIGRGVSKQAYLSNQAHNDWIFSVLSEETGFIGATLVIILFLLLVIRGFKIALETKDFKNKLIACGITISLGLQAFINMGVAIGVVPSTGITLPFISYGGSALISSYIMIGILLSISRKNTEKNWIYR